MSSAIAGLIGAMIGAGAGVTGALITQLMQARTERAKWLRSKKEETYANALRYLLRMRNRRSAIEPGGKAYISEEHRGEWLSDIVDAQFWTSILTIYCSEDQKSAIAEVSQDLNSVVEDIAWGKASSMQGIEYVKYTPKRMARWHEKVLTCAREDVGATFE